MTAGPFDTANLPTVNATLCISVAARPSRFGITVHNAGYRALGLDFLYKAFQVSDIAGAMAGVRALGIRGCSVSMPFKEAVIAHLDSVDRLADAVGAVNTVVNEGGRLTGYNTDVGGAFEALKPCGPVPNDRVVVMGAGGVARAVLQALRSHGLSNVTVCARRPDAARSVAERFGVVAAEWEKREVLPAEILVNATPVGMAPDTDSMPVSAKAAGRYRIVMDVVASPPITRLVEKARRAGAETVDGLTMTLYQACAQFRLYTGREAPFDVMQEAARSLQ